MAPGDYSNTRPNYPTPSPSFNRAVQPEHGYSFLDDTLAFPPLDTSTTSDAVYHDISQVSALDLTMNLAPPAGPFTQSAINDNEAVISVSTSFHPNAQPAPDTIFSASDGVLFYVFSETVISACPTAFQSIIGYPLSHPKFRAETIPLDAPSPELNIIFHVLYGTSPASNCPDFKTLERAVDRMPVYSLSPEDLIRPSGSVYELLLLHAPLHPIDVYALAAHHNLHSLAVSVSSHLLSFDMLTISDETAERMGPIYFKKLLQLHLARFSALKAILLQPPHPHPPSRTCGFEDQRKLTRAWALVTACLAWNATPDFSTQTIRNALIPMTDNLTCDMCLQTLKDKIKDVVVQWTSIKRAAWRDYVSRNAPFCAS